MKRILLFGLFCWSRVFAQDVPVVLTGATVVVGNGRILTQATVVMRAGRIEAAGPGVPVPAAATVIDARGLHVYPGLINALTEQGFRSPAKTPEGPMFASTKASDSLDLDAKTIAGWRNGRREDS